MIYVFVCDVCVCLFFFFKQKTAYEMRISDWSSDVCSSDLYRPGPMDNIPMFGRRKNGHEEIEYPHALLEGILKETYGIFVYQEQVMQAAQILAGYSLGDRKSVV